MEHLPKSVENKAQDRGSSADIFEPRVEKEIQKVLATEQKDLNEPSCSNQISTLKSKSYHDDENCKTVLEIVHSEVPKNLTDRPNTTISLDKSIENTDPAHRHIECLDPKLNLSCSDIIPNLFDNLEPVTPSVPHAVLSSEETQRPNIDTVLSLEEAHIPGRNFRGSPEPTPNTQSPRALPNNVPSVNLNNYYLAPNPNRGRTLNDNYLEVSRMQPSYRRESAIGPPPSYSKSALDRRINPCTSIQFVAPIPPPSYEGMDNELRYVNCSGFTIGLGNTWQFQSQPAYCPICETVTITRTDIRVSRLAHTLALLMFFLLCWPFCLLPYFLKICNYTFHYCSVCHCYLGARRPFQRS